MSYNLKANEKMNFTNDDVCLMTANATAQIIYTINTKTDSGNSIFLRIMARRDSGTGTGSDNDTASYNSNILIKNNAGTVSIVGSDSSTPIEDNAAWDVTWVVNGTDFEIKVQGDADNTVDWFGTIKIFEMI